VITLVLAEIVSYFGLKLLIDFIHVMHHQDIFSGDGTVGFEFETPVTFWMLKGQESLSSPYDRLLKLLLKKRLP